MERPTLPVDLPADLPADTARLELDDSPASILRDVAAVGRISAVPALLRILCDNTGMGFAAVARVTAGTWTACAVQDDIAFGLLPGGQLDLRTTLCHEVRGSREPIVIDQASLDPQYRDHHTPRIYGIESYVSVPIVFSDGVYFGNLCAIDPRPAKVSEPRTVAMFVAYAELIARQLESEAHSDATSVALQAERAKADLREQFIAVLGHDLRNPLSAVAAMAELLVRRNIEPQSVELGRRIRAATSRMSGLIDDVLDLARGRLGAGIGVESTEIIDLAAALRDVVAELRAAHPARVIVETIVIDRRVRGDCGRLQQLLSNLLANALTHGAADQPVEVEAVLVDDTLRIAVANQGEPISADNLAHVFEPYWRSATSKPGGGLGLGLYICAQIVKAHGGTIDLSSSAEAGTRFVARLPQPASG